MSEFDELMASINAGKHLKRLKWKRDEPATDKQFNYAEVLLSKIQGRLPPLSMIEDEDEKLVYKFWTHATIPDDLTKIEASALIDGMLQTRLDGGTPRGLVEAILKRVEGGPQTNTPFTIFTSVWSQSSQFVLDIIAEKMPDKLGMALSIRAEREAKLAAEKAAEKTKKQAEKIAEDAKPDASDAGVKADGQ